MKKLLANLLHFCDCHVFGFDSDGEGDARVRAIVKAMGLTIVAWNLDSKDSWSVADAAVADTTVSALSSKGTVGKISLQHDLNDFQTVKAAPIAKIVRDNNYKIKTVADCLSLSPYLAGTLENPTPPAPSPSSVVPAPSPAPSSPPVVPPSNPAPPVVPPSNPAPPVVPPSNPAPPVVTVNPPKPAPETQPEVAKPAPAPEVIAPPVGPVSSEMGLAAALGAVVIGLF